VKADGWTDEIETTLLGETINRSACSADSFHIFDPCCRSVGDGVYRFARELPGDDMWDQLDDAVGPDRIVVANLMGWWTSPLQGLLASEQSFQFVANPGTEDERRYRIARGGKAQRIGGGSLTPFRLDLPAGEREYPRITIETKGPINFQYLDDDGKVSSTRKGIYADLSLNQLKELAGIWYALNALDEEAFAIYGRIIGQCAMCGRRLEDAASMKRGLGPDCAKRLKVTPAAKQGDEA